MEVVIAADVNYVNFRIIDRVVIICCVLQEVELACNLSRIFLHNINCGMQYDLCVGNNGVEPGVALCKITLPMAVMEY